MPKKFRTKMHDDFESFPWADAAWRIASDFVMLTAAILLAFTCWFFFYVVVLDPRHPADLKLTFTYFARGYWAFWSLVGVAVFTCYGFYTRTRGYVGRYKVAVVCGAVTMFVVIFVFADYFFLRTSLVPRGVALLGWGFALLFVGGSRLLKAQVLERFIFERKAPTGPAAIERVCVVGGAGYVGSAIVPMLLQQGYKVRVLDAFLFGQRSLDAVKDHPNCEIVQGDVRNIERVVEAFKGCQAVIHLAAIVGDPACEEARPLAVEINRAATRMLIEVAKGYGVRRFLFASTCSVYGASDYLVDEFTNPAPISTYARTKVESEQLLLEACDGRFETTILRLGTLFGLSSRPRFDLVVNLLTARAATKGEITIYNGDQWRPFLHVTDAARAFVMCLNADASMVAGQIFNVSDYELNLRLREVSERISALIPTVKVSHVDNSDKRNYRASCDKIARRLGFRCEKTLEYGIEEIYHAIASGEIGDYSAEQFNNVAVVRAFAAGAESNLSSVRNLAKLAEVN